MQKSLVCIFLNGGNDGLNASCRSRRREYAAYQAARSNIARVHRRVDRHARSARR